MFKLDLEKAEEPVWAAVHTTHIVVHSLSCVWIFVTPWTTARHLPCLSPTPGACSYSCPLNWWCHSTSLSSVAPFSSCSQSFLSSGSFPMSWLFTSNGQNTRASASASVLPKNIQGWFSVGLTGLISLQSRGISRVICSTTVQKHLFFSTQPSLWSNTHIYTWLQEKP